MKCCSKLIGTSKCIVILLCTIYFLYLFKGKEVACNITRLAAGSVVFEDVGTEEMKGQVLKPLERGQQLRHLSDPLPGRIRYRAADHSEVEIPFGDKDQRGDFTLRQV